MKINFLNLNKKQIADFIFLFILLVVGAAALFNSDSGILISSAQERTALFKEENLKFSFSYPIDFSVARNNLPDHSLILMEKNLEGDATNKDFFKSGRWIGITFKESALDMPKGKVFLDPEEYISREASGIDEVIASEKIQVNDYLFYKVTRLAAGTDKQIQMFYHFRDSKVFRLGIYPYNDPDSRIEKVEHILSSLKFE